MTKAVKKGMVYMRNINDVNYVMYLYSVTLAAMKEAIAFLMAKGQYFVTSVQQHLQRCPQNKRFKLWRMLTRHTQKSKVKLRKCFLGNDCGSSRKPYITIVKYLKFIKRIKGRTNKN